MVIRTDTILLFSVPSIIPSYQFAICSSKTISNRYQLAMTYKSALLVLICFCTLTTSSVTLSIGMCLLASYAGRIKNNDRMIGQIKEYDSHTKHVCAAKLANLAN